MIKTIALLVFFGAVSAQAALPPTAESMRRLRAVLDSKELYEAIAPYNWIRSIEHKPDGTYRVGAEECSADVKVEPVVTNPPQMVPPLKVTVSNVFCYPG